MAELLYGYSREKCALYLIQLGGPACVTVIILLLLTYCSDVLTVRVY